MTAFSKQKAHIALSLSSRLRLMLIQCYSSFSDLWPTGEGDREWLMIFFAILISAGGAIGASVIKWGVISLGATITPPFLCLFTSISPFIHLFSSFHSILTPLVPSLIAVEVESLMTILLCAARRQRFSLQLLQRSNSLMVPAPSHFGPRTSFHYQLSPRIKESNFFVLHIYLWYLLTVWICLPSYG